ncbi:S-layer protein [Lysinibacillus sp. CTST325]
MYELVCKCKKSTCFTAIIFLSILVILSGCQKKEDDSTLMKKNEENSTLTNDNEKLIVSIFDNEGKSSIVELDVEKNVEEELVTNETVWLHASLSDNKQYLAYTSAKGDGPWEIYLLDRNDKKTYQVTNDTLGQLIPRFGDNNTLYSEILGATFPVSKISKIDVQKKNSIVFDTKQPDRAVEMYDTSKDKIIGAFVSEEENTARRKAANDAGVPLGQIVYSIYEMNLDGSDMNLVTKIKAVNIDSMAYGSNGNSVILGGKNINEDEGSGIYQLSLTDKTITTILTDQMIKISKNPLLSEIGQRRLAVLSKNERFIYFSGIPKNAEDVSFDGIISKIQCIYKYDLDNKEITKVYEYKKPAFVTDMTVTY